MMEISYSSARNAGLGVLLLLVLAGGVFSYTILNRQGEAIQKIVSRDEEVLRRWRAVGEMIAEAKDRMYDYRLGKSHSVAAVDLLLFRVIREVSAIRTMADDRRERESIEALMGSATDLRQMLGDRQERLVEPSFADDAIRMANRMVLLGRSAVDYVNHRVDASHRDLLARNRIYQRLLVAGIVFAFAATIAIAFFLHRFLSRPLEKLVEGTRRLAAGHLRHQVEIRGQDEIGLLSQSFNAMSAELERSHSELLDAKRFLDNVLLSMINSLVVVDKDGVILKVNEATCNLLSYRQDEMVGRLVAMLFPEGYYERLKFADLVAREVGDQVETAFLSREGRLIPMLLSSSVMRDGTGAVQGIVLVAQDITLQAEAQRAGHLASLGELAAGVAHEINNPLNSIINFAQILLDELEENGAVTSADVFRRIMAEGDRVTAIVRSLLSFAREEDLPRAEVLAGDLVAETLALTESQLLKDGIEIDINGKENVPAFKGYFQQLQQVLLNLINNARYALNQKYPGQHPGKKLCISWYAGRGKFESMVVLEVVDFGTGIPAAILNRVKNPFFSTKPAGMGTGLGLAISHGIVSEHGGQLFIESVDEEFTKVMVVLPAAETVA
ncbi:MAG: PAS domain S-box protein [Thermodesulfobacteriota bacterium]